MKAQDFEYAIRQDVRNNAIVREVDRARWREFVTWTVLGVATVLVIVASLLPTFELISLGYDIEAMRTAKAEQERINRHLRLELETLRSPARIARIATDQLDLVPPDPRSAIVIERVPAGTPPAKGLVASR
jgi:cell division protein FtsL